MTDNTADRPDLPDHIQETVQALAEFHAEHHRRAPPIQRVVHRLVRLVSRPRFVAMVTIFVGGWIALNLVLGRFGAAFDAPPFPTLQGIAQLAALYMTVLILITQRHEDELTERRQQLTLELVMLSEQKNAKIVELIEEMRRDNPMIKDRVDTQAEALSVAADPLTVLDAIKEKQGEMLAAVDAEHAAGSTGPDAV
ncbi:MAG: DUF1003 domain-containing protein [Pseudomonadota bacterium]|nr:DUF1003 domain-containing protein [Pseudomonadota bacterium]